MALIMSGFSQFIATIDFETTALSKAADVIEVGVAIFDRQETIKTWSSLVRPSPNCLWSDQSAQVHKISRLDLEIAPEPSTVATELNRIMAGALTAFCDGYQYDRFWMSNLFRDAGIESEFSIAPIEEMPRMHVDTLWRQMNAYLDRTMVPHRAGDDALRLMQAYTHSIGKKPNVVTIE